VNKSTKKVIACEGIKKIFTKKKKRKKNVKGE